MTDTSRRRLATLQMITAGGIAAFWSLFFTVGLAPENPPPGYFAFEHAFPFPDLLLAAALLGAASALRSADAARQARGRWVSLVCAGGLLFLGCVDLSFNLQNRMYTVSLADGVLAAGLQIWCLALGFWTIRVCRGERTLVSPG
jgi:hypothetical protein